MANKIILGINWELNSTASLMINGNIVSTASEERFSKIKNDERYPYQAINYILSENNIKKKISIMYVLFLSFGLQLIVLLDIIQNFLLMIMLKNRKTTGIKEYIKIKRFH